MDSVDLHESMDERADRRLHDRAKVSLFARFMMPDKVEYPCQVINASPSSLAVISAQTAEIGTHCIFYVTHLGRIEGHITRTFLGGFAAELTASERKREKIATKIDWVVNHAKYGTPEHRVHERKAPKNSLSEVFTAGRTLLQVQAARHLAVGRGDGNGRSLRPGITSCARRAGRHRGAPVRRRLRDRVSERADQ